MLQVFYNTYGYSAIPAGGKGWRVAVPESTRQGRRGVLGRLWRQAQHPNTLVPQHAPHGPQHLLRPQLLPPLKARPEGMIANSEKGSKTIGKLGIFNFRGAARTQKCGIIEKALVPGPPRIPRKSGYSTGL